MSSSPRVALTGDRLSVIGDIVPENAAGLRKEGERLIAGQDQGLVVDLTGLGAAHSVVLSLLLCWMRLARSRNQSLRFEGVGGRLHALAELSGLGEHFSEPSRS